MSAEPSAPLAPLEPFKGGQKLMMAAGGIGVVGLGLTAVALVTNPARAYPSYLLGFAYWVGIAFASLLMVAIFNTAAAQWMTVLRRQMENHASALVVLAIFVVPLFFGMKHLYLWADEEKVHTLASHTQHLLHHKHAWLNVNGFIIRSVICFAVWIGAWFLLNRNTRLQEGKAPDDALRSANRGLSAGLIPFLAITITIAAIDWMMSMEPEWFSAMFGVYYFAGSFLSAFCVLALTITLPTDPNLPASRLKIGHVHNVGSLMFAFTCFWAYIGFSQYMIIWHANIPEEVSWLAARGLYNLARFHQVGEGPPIPAEVFGPTGAKWFPVTAFLFIGHFPLPFIAMLSYYVKRSRKFLTVIAAWLLVMQFVDLYWVIMPSVRIVDPSMDGPSFYWADITAWLGIGGIAVAFVVWRMRGKNALPVNDPTLDYSLRYHQP